MDATYAISLEGSFVAPENIVVLGSELDVFAGNVYQFLGGVSSGSMDVTYVEQ